MENAPDRAPRKAAVIFVFVTVALDMIALGVIAPVFVPLVEGFMHQNVVAAAGVVGVFGTVFALMQFVWAPVMGVLSDRYGRRPIIVLSNLGMAVDYAVMALAPNLIWLLLGRVVSGVTSANATAASAYIADVTPAEKRAGAFGMIGAAFGLGFVLGPALGGLCGQFDPRLPFWVAGGLSLLNGIYGALVVPESLAPEHRAVRFLWSKANPVGALRLLRRHRELMSLGVLTFASTLAGIAMQSTWVLYVTARYGWGPGATGVSLALHRRLLVGRAGRGDRPLRQALRRAHRALRGDRLRRARPGDLRPGGERLVVLPSGSCRSVCGGSRPPRRRR